MDGHHPIWCCQRCGAEVGWLGRAINAVIGCKWRGRACPHQPSNAGPMMASSLDNTPPTIAAVDQTSESLLSIDDQIELLRKITARRGKLCPLAFGDLVTPRHASAPDFGRPHAVVGLRPSPTRSGGDILVVNIDPYGSTLVVWADSSAFKHWANEGAIAEGASTAPAWPANSFEVLKASYPRKEGWLRAEKALERIRADGETSWREILAGIERLAAEGPFASFVPLAASWLTQRGWETSSVEPIDLSCSTDRAAELAKEIFDGVISGELSLTSDRAVLQYLLGRTWQLSEASDLVDLDEARRVVLRTIEDRARRASAFAEPRQ